MELLKRVQYMQTEKYRYELKRESLKHSFGLDLTEFQIDVLMANCDDKSLTIYAKQPRRAGTSTALLLKVLQSIFVDKKYNNKHIISKSNHQSSYLKDRMMVMIGQAGLLDRIVRNSRHMIEFDFGTRIHFENDNPLNLTGVSGPEFFFDDYDMNNISRNLEFNSIMRTTFPTHIHYFLQGSELEEEHIQLLFN
jgi:hypothetical protein